MGVSVGSVVVIVVIAGVVMLGVVITLAMANLLNTWLSQVFFRVIQTIFLCIIDINLLRLFFLSSVFQLPCTNKQEDDDQQSEQDEEGQSSSGETLILNAFLQ